MRKVIHTETGEILLHVQDLITTEVNAGQITYTLRAFLEDKHGNRNVYPYNQFRFLHNELMDIKPTPDPVKQESPESWVPLY